MSITIPITVIPKNNFLTYKDCDHWSFKTQTCCKWWKKGTLLRQFPLQIFRIRSIYYYLYKWKLLRSCILFLYIQVNPPMKKLYKLFFSLAHNTFLSFRVAAESLTVTRSSVDRLKVYILFMVLMNSTRGSKG